MKKTKQQKFWVALWQSAKDGLRPEWKDLIWIATAIVTCLIAIPIVISWRTRDIKAAAMECNREFLATFNEPGIRDLAGNALDGDGDGTPGGDFVYRFTVTEDPNATPYPICTAVYCPAGQLVCPVGSECLGGCGMVCALDETPVPEMVPYMVCAYYDNGSSWCYENPVP